MKSYLKKIYEQKDNFDILNMPRYYFMANPIYQVNKFILDKGNGLNANLISNLEDLKIVNKFDYPCQNSYDYETNTLYCGNDKSDIFGLLHVASNNKKKKYTGIIIRNNITKNKMGYGLNNGLTEVLANEINNKPFSYPFEATIAKTLLMINPKIVIDSYFNNSGEDIFSISKYIKDLMMYLDSFHGNNIQLTLLKREQFAKTINKFKTDKEKQELEYINNEIYNLEVSNYTDVYNIFRILINIINNSCLSNGEKQELFTRLYNEFNLLFMTEAFNYLFKLKHEFKKDAYIKKRIK